MRRSLLAWCACLLLAPAAAAAQSGSGTTGGAVLQIPGGSRAAGMAGAYTGGTDIDALFHNPAGIARLRAAASASYQRHVAEMGYASAAGALRLGPLALGVAVASLDYGSIAEVTPDPTYGGERGEETGRRVDASETAARLAVAAPFAGGRLAAGGSIGLMWTAIAETGRTAVFFDAGAQYRAAALLTLGAGLRHAGGRIEGARLGPADLPTEVRAGATWQLPERLAGPATFRVASELVVPVNDGGPALAAGAEATIPAGDSGVTGALRAGFNGAVGASGAGRVHLGAGLALDAFALDYAFQDMGALGAVHRFGVRWSRAQ